MHHFTSISKAFSMVRMALAVRTPQLDEAFSLALVRGIEPRLVAVELRMTRIGGSSRTYRTEVHDDLAAVAARFHAIELDRLETVLAEDVGVTPQPRGGVIPDHAITWAPSLDRDLRPASTRLGRRLLTLAAMPNSGDRVEHVVVDAVDHLLHIRMKCHIDGQVANRRK
jgi:hypothetical protein